MKIHKTVDTPHDPLKVVDNPSNEAGDRKDLISTMTIAGLGPIREAVLNVGMGFRNPAQRAVLVPRRAALRAVDVPPAH
jgi:hypothetical protein